MPYKSDTYHIENYCQATDRIIKVYQYDFLRLLQQYYYIDHLEDVQTMESIYEDFKSAFLRMINFNKENRNENPLGKYFELLDFKFLINSVAEESILEFISINKLDVGRPRLQDRWFNKVSSSEIDHLVKIKLQIVGTLTYLVYYETRIS